jgi:hypothetical protein
MNVVDHYGFYMFQLLAYMLPNLNCAFHFVNDMIHHHTWHAGNKNTLSCKITQSHSSLCKVSVYSIFYHFIYFNVMFFCVCLRMMVSNTYCVVFLFCFSSSRVLCMMVSNTYCVVFLFCLSSSRVLCMMVSDTYCVVFLFCLSSFRVLCMMVSDTYCVVFLFCFSSPFLCCYVIWIFQFLLVIFSSIPLETS